MSRTSSLHCLSCRNPYQTPHSLNPSPLFTENPFLSLKSALSDPLPKIGSEYLYVPMALKVCQFFLILWHWSMDGSSHEILDATVALGSVWPMRGAVHIQPECQKSKERSQNGFLGPVGSAGAKKSPNNQIFGDF